MAVLQQSLSWWFRCVVTQKTFSLFDEIKVFVVLLPYPLTIKSLFKRYLFLLPIAALFVACNNQKQDKIDEYPKRIDDRLYTTDSTFHIMDGADTLTKLLHERTLGIAYSQRIGNRLYTTDSTFHLMKDNDTLTKLLNAHTLEIVE